MVHFLIACLPHAKHLTTEKHIEFFGKIVDTYCAITQQNNEHPILFKIPEPYVEAFKPEARQEYKNNLGYLSK